MLSCYQQLGGVFDRITDAIVKEYWLPLVSTFDEFDTDAANQIEIVFSWLHEHEWHEGDTLKKFGEYMTEHPKLFTGKNQQLIYGAAEKIAASFHGFNKKDTTFLHQLSALLAY